MSFESELCLLGQKRNIIELQELIKSTSKETILDQITELIHKENFINFWDYLLQGFDNSHESHAKRFQACQRVLNELENQNIPNARCTSIIISFVIEFKKFLVDHVLFFSKYCVEKIQKGKSICTIWKDIFPAVLKTLENVELFDYNGEETTGLEYKETIVRALCILEWNPNIIVPLTIMFTEISLNNDEHKSVVKNLCCAMEKLTAQEIPAFVYQLLSLCANRNSEIVFLKLQQYFGSRVYNNNNFVENSESLDFICNAADADIIQSESTVLFHVHGAASRNSDAILHYLATLKHLTKVPDCLLYPSHLTMLLTIASVDRCELSVIQAVIHAIDSSLTERERGSESHWYREQVSNDINHEKIFKQIILCSQEARDSLLQGLVHLSFSLLAVKKCPATKDSVVEDSWKLGSFILVRLIKQKRNMANSILRTLTNEIMRSQNGDSCIPYLDCLHTLCGRFTLDMLKNRTCIIDLMETALLVNEFVANQILDSILPLTKASQSLRDELVLFLKKALYSRKLDTRKIAVNGFLKLLRHLRITDVASLSQMSNSSGSASSSNLSVFTQMSLARFGHASGSSNSSATRRPGGAGGAFSNEALCWEIVATLRRCFSFQADVRIQLYDGLYDTICANSILGVPIMDAIFAHFNSYYISNVDSLPPIKINKIAKIEENDAVLIEPLGKFIYTIGLIINKIQESENGFEGMQKYVDILENLCERMPRCELVHFELDDGTDLCDILPESQLKVFILKESLQIYEALIGYKICTWNPESKNNSNTIFSLWQGYNRLLQFAKDCAKSKKGRKKDKEVSTINVDAPKKDNNPKPKSIKLPNSILDLQSTGKMLNLLLRPQVDWTNFSQSDVLKNKIEIHQYILQATLNIIQNFKNNKDPESKRMKAFYGYCTEIAATLYEKCIEKYTDYVDFDEKSANLALEIFYFILEQMYTNFLDKIINFLHVVGGKSKDADIDVHLKVIIDVYLKLFKLDEDDPSDAETGKMLLTVINTIKLLAKLLPVKTTALSIQLVNWTKAFLNEKTLRYKNSVSVFINLTFSLQMKYKTSLLLFKNVSLRLGDIYGTIDEEKEAVEEIKLVNELTADTILTELHVTVKLYLQDVDYMLIRLKSEYYLIKRIGDEGNAISRLDNLKKRERGVCCQLCLIIDLISTVINLKIQLGPISEAVMKNLAHIFTTLCSITQYFLTRSSTANPNSAIQNSRFESVIQKAGKQLSPIVYNLLIYLEESESAENVSTTSQTRKKKTETLKTKVWRDRKRFPQVVYGMERFSSLVSQLTTRSKINLSKYIGQGTTRDFRIKADALKEIQKNVTDVDDTIDTTAMTTQNSDRSVTADASAITNNDVTNGGDSDSDATPRKKKKNNK